MAKVNGLESLREKVRKQLADRYKRDLEKGSLTIADIQQMIHQLQKALEKAKKTNLRVLVKGQEHLGSLGIMEIEDQISALRRTLWMTIIVVSFRPRKSQTYKIEKCIFWNQTSDMKHPIVAGIFSNLTKILNDAPKRKFVNVFCIKLLETVFDI